MNFMRITLIFLAAIFIAACKKEGMNVEQSPKNVFIAKFIDNWLPHGYTGYIFISDMDGNVLADSSWQGDKELHLRKADGSNFPDKIIVTTITVDPNVHYIFLHSNLAVSPGTWIWKGYPSVDYSQKIYFNYQNIPTHSKYRISVHNHSRNGSNIVNRTHISVPYNINNIYFYLNTLANGPEYLWITNKYAEDTINVDFSNLKKLSTKKISLPGWGNGYRIFIYGFPVANDHYSQRYLLQYSYDRDSVINSFTVYYPTKIFSSYRASLYILDDYNTKGWKDYYGYIKYGSDLPSSFVKMNADFNLKSNSPLDFSIDANGNFDEIQTYWKYSDNSFFQWSVYGPNTLTSYRLPIIPQNIMAKINGLKREMFYLSQVFLIDQLGLNSYDDIISTYFKSTKHFYDIVDGTLLRSKKGEL